MIEPEITITFTEPEARLLGVICQQAHPFLADADQHEVMRGIAGKFALGSVAYIDAFVAEHGAEKAEEIAEEIVGRHPTLDDFEIVRTDDAAIADFLQEALDETADMEEPHKGHMLRVKVLSRISALRPTNRP